MERPGTQTNTGLILDFCSQKSSTLDFLMRVHKHPRVMALHHITFKKSNFLCTEQKSKDQYLFVYQVFPLKNCFNQKVTAIISFYCKIADTEHGTMYTSFRKEKKMLLENGQYSEQTWSGYFFHVKKINRSHLRFSVSPTYVRRVMTLIWCSKECPISLSWD